MDQKEFLEKLMREMLHMFMELTDNKVELVGLLVSTEEDLHYVSMTILSDAEADPLEEQCLYNAFLKAKDKRNEIREVVSTIPDS